MSHGSKKEFRLRSATQWSCTFNSAVVVTILIFDQILYSYASSLTRSPSIKASAWRITMRKFALAAVAFSAAVWLATPACAAPFSFSTGNPDGRLGALSRRPSAGKIETETADDFVLTDTTVITGATISGLL